MNFLRIFGVVARERVRALRSQADTLFYVAEPCITGMTPSVRRPLCAQVPDEPMSRGLEGKRMRRSGQENRPGLVPKARRPAEAGRLIVNPGYRLITC
jgi:hypothetical protein